MQGGGRTANLPHTKRKRLPGKLEKRDRLAGEIDRDFESGLADIHPARRIHELQLAGGGYLRVLAEVGILRGTEVLPGGVGVAVGLVDAVMAEQDAALIRRQAR